MTPCNVLSAYDPRLHETSRNTLRLRVAGVVAVLPAIAVVAVAVVVAVLSVVAVVVVVAVVAAVAAVAVVAVVFLSVCNKHAPVRRKIMRGVKCPWLQAATKKLMNERDFVLRKARRSGSEVDWSMYRRLRNQVSNRIKIEKRRYQRNEISDNMDNPKSFWKIMKNIFPGDKEKITTPKSIKTDYGKTVIDQPTIARRFNEFFTGVVSRLLETAGLSTSVRQFSSGKFTSERFILQPISEKFILKQLGDLKVKKATGLDGIPARFLKDSAAVIAPTVTFLVNLSLSTGSLPD